MQASAYAFDVETGFDRSAAEAYLRELRGQPAPGRRAGKPSRQDPKAEAEAPLVAPPLHRPSRRKSHSRTIAAVVMAIAAPASIGAGVFYWTTSRPADPATASAPLRDTAPAGRSEANAYSVTDPVSVDAESTPGPPNVASNEAARFPRARAHFPAARATPAPAAADEPAPDYASYGILDPAPAAPRPADSAAN